MSLHPQMQNEAMGQALAPQGPGPQGPPMGPPEEPMLAQGVPPGPGDMQSMPGFPPELMAIAKALGLDINDPNALAILLQMLGAGGGGQMGPMAGAPEEVAPPMPPQGPPMPPMGPQ